MELAPNNSVPDQFNRELGADGAPAGMTASPGREFLGYVPLMTRGGAKRATLHRQQSEPDPPTQDAHLFDRPVVSGGAPATAQTPGAVVPADGLEAPEVRLVRADRVGFPPGEYLGAISLKGRGGAHTTTTEPARFSVTADGKLVEFALLTGLDRELVGGQGLWVSEPAPLGEEPDPSTLRWQADAPVGPRTHLLKGYNWKGRRAPRRNETAIGRPEPFKRNRDYRLRGGQGKDLEGGRWLFYRVETTRAGDSEPSRHGERVEARDRKGHGYVFSPEKLHEEATGYKVFAQDLDEADAPPTYQLVRVRRADRSRPFNRQERPVFFGNRAAESVSTDEGDGQGDRPRYLLVQSEPPTEDSSGIEPPSGEIDPPVAVGSGRPAPGDYLVGYAKSYRNGETPASALARVTVPAPSAEGAGGWVVQMRYPPRANKIPNAVYGQLDQKGLPLYYEVRNSANVLATTTTADIGFERAGVPFLQTAGQLNNAGNYPNWRTSQTELMAVDRDRVETVAGFLEVSGHVQGFGYVELIQHDDAGAVLKDGNNNDLPPLALATLAQNGKVWVERTVAGLGADIALNDACAFAAVRWGAAGNPRNLRVRWHSQVWPPSKGIARRFEAQASPLEHAAATTDPAIPYASGHVLKIGPPPPTASGAALEDGAPLEEARLDALADGAEPPGWTQTLTNAGTGGMAGAYPSSVWGGAKVWRARSDNKGAKSTATMQKAFSPSGNALACLFRVHLEQAPTRSPSSAVVGWILAGDGRPMGRLQVKRTGGGARALELWLLAGSRSGRVTATRLLSGLANADNVECEVLVGGGDTASGAVSTNIGVNGADRSPGPSQTALDFAGMLPTLVRVGGGEESHSDTRWAFQFAPPVVTERGAASVENRQPALTAIPQPDAPLRGGEVVHGPAPTPLDQAVPATDEAAIAVTANRSGTLSSERLLARLTTSSGAEVAGLYARADNAVEARAPGGPYPVLASLPLGADHRFEAVVSGAGTPSGALLAYRTAPNGVRELVVQKAGLDLTGLQIARAVAPGGANLSATNVLVTRSGELLPDLEGPDGEPAHQEYVAVSSADAIEGEAVGFELDEIFVRPGVQRTAAVYLRPENVPEGDRPFTIVQYDDSGAGSEVACLWEGNTLALPGGNGWVERWLTYTPTEKRVRWEHGRTTGGRYAAYKRLDRPGNLATRAQRDSWRNEGRAVEGTFSVPLLARVPGQDGTQMRGQWSEERVSLGVASEVPADDSGNPTGSVTARYRAAEDEGGLASAAWRADPTLVPDLKHVEAEVTLTGDGSKAGPTVPRLGARLDFRCFHPVLLRQDRSHLPGGVYLGADDRKLPRPFSRSLFDTEAPGDRAAPRSTTPEVGRLWGFQMNVFTPEALDVLQSDLFLDEDWYVESPAHGLVMRVRFYEPPSEPEPLAEYTLLDEGMRFWVPQKMQVERAEVVETGGF